MDGSCYISIKIYLDMVAMVHTAAIEFIKIGFYSVFLLMTWQSSFQ